MDPATEKSSESKYWIEPGINVRLKWGGPVMEVMRILQTRTLMPDGTKMTKMQGVKCRWIDDFGDEQTGVYHSKDLVKA